MGIVLDDYNRKPICRLWFNTKQNYLGIIGHRREETRYSINSHHDIYQHADKILDVLARHEGQ